MIGILAEQPLIRMAAASYALEGFLSDAGQKAQWHRLPSDELAAGSFPLARKKHSMDAESFTLTVGGLSLDNLERYLVEKHSFKVWSDALSYVYWSVYFLMALFETHSEFEKIFSKKE